MPLNVNFQNYSIGSNLIYGWDFGDGNNSSQSYPLQHTYTLTDTVGYVDTLMCCFSQYWDGSVWSVPGGTPTPSWDCDPVSGCYDPNNGLGQYTTLASCQSICIIVPQSWDCDPSTGLCSDPGNGNGQYSSFSNCANNL